ncbi:hypothetical protein HJC23_012173 [Cyclotella cryptica]|uniref:DUF7640 domain-containing protein n=1 Tax=Cyclotella cryptica TaxID=29204 RepID=A0ABD3PAC0_9STRA
MRFTFPATIIASISRGPAFLATSSSHQVDASIDIAYVPSEVSVASSMTQGTECFFVDGFKVKETHIDTGILGCTSYESCVEDVNSSAGGRCVANRDFMMTVKSHRELYDGTPCTFLDGTPGVKCSGDSVPACSASVDRSNIGCGSCIGDYSCDNLAEGTTVGENSCVGLEACRYLEGTVGDNSCISYAACMTANVTIGDNSCVGGDTPGPNGTVGYPCFHFIGEIGDNSCNNQVACQQYYDSEYVL